MDTEGLPMVKAPQMDVIAACTEHRLRGQTTGSHSQLCHFLAGCFGASHLISPRLSILISRMGVIIALTTKGGCEDLSM